MSVNRANFSARARVVDLLGREQIADAPTAINELLKNAVDALATKADVRFDPRLGRLQVEDDGLGMRTEDLLRKWLVLATESKKAAADGVTSEYRRHAGRKRLQQAAGYAPLGEKGIGRLAVAALGRGVLVWTRWGEGESTQRTLLLIHWRVFEHPRLELSDIIIPYVNLDGKTPSSDDLLGLTRELEQWILDSEDLWQTEGEQEIREVVLRDLRVDFPNAFEGLQFLPEMGTLFGILGTTPEVEQMFEDIQPQGEERTQAEGFKLLLGFCDPFSRGDKRLDVKYFINGKRPNAEKTFWTPEDFSKVDHEVTLEMSADGFVSGRVRRFQELFDYNYQVTKPARLARLPGPLKIHIGYVEGQPSTTQMPRDEHLAYNERLLVFGALYVYRDTIRVLPYGRTDQDFLGFEERRSRNAGSYFFSYRRMFGAVYLTTRQNPDLKDKAGREGFIKNGAYRGLLAALREIFFDLARRYFGRNADRPDKRKKQEAKDKAAAERAQERIRAEKLAFEADLEKWKAELPAFESEAQRHFAALDNKLKEVRQATQTVGSGDAVEMEASLSECATLLNEARGCVDRALTSLGDAAPPSVQLEGAEVASFDRYLSGREQFQTHSSRRVARLATRYEQLSAQFRPLQERIEQIRRRIEDVQHDYESALDEALESFTNQGQQVVQNTAPGWRARQLEELRSSLATVADTDPAVAVATDTDGRIIAALETALLQQKARLREVHLPFWQLVTGQMEHLDSVESGEFALGELNRLLEQVSAREQIFAELAQFGLVVESLDHEFNVLFGNLREDLIQMGRGLTTSGKGAETLLRMRRSFESLEAKLRLLSPLYRRRLGSVGDLSGEEIRGVVEDYFPATNREGVTISYTKRFLEMELQGVNKPVLQAATINMVGNGMHWTAQSARAREVRFSSAPGGFVLSDSGPGVAARDAERIFEPFFSRRPYGRGLGLYIARTNLEASGLEIILSDKPQKSALPGANFIIRKRPINAEIEED